ncbi:AAA family ATPase [Leucothrix pacifica]|uniref:Recombinase RecF n=1 Tax=Leucothrix pacifica TaxID=1247513 RepID=A0A317C819_9GAMM|nr:AAA family ATPase [Leucothrix pacifica]PWQ92272.1 recombinase RecF [Leucothrix pacifica]
MSDQATNIPINRLTIQGFKSIQRLDDFSLNNLNVLIGANGSGKSNLVSYFSMLGNMLGHSLQVWGRKQGGADRVLFNGVKETQQLHSEIVTGEFSYQFTLEPTVDEGFVFQSEVIAESGQQQQLGGGQTETKLSSRTVIRSWQVYHFHDTSDTAGVKRLSAVHHNEKLRSDASNLAAFLYRLQQENPNHYTQIIKTIRLAIPFFDDFVLKPQKLPSEEQQIRLLWKQTDSDYSLWPSQLSDGSIRFICLVTALLQPDPPSTIIIDEPELGLHPYAISLLGSLLRSASSRMQVIVSTQSVPLVNEFELDDLIVVEREQGATVFKRLDGDRFNDWLEDYSVGELWEKNILGGRPR